MNGRPPRVLFYSHNGVGVGHFRRQLRLAGELRRRRPDAAILLVSGSHAASALSGPHGFDVISLPSIRMVDRYENWEPRQPGLGIDEVMRVRSDLLTRTVRQFKPDVLVADFMPTGPYGELLGALEELRAGGGCAVAGFRDIIDEPGFTKDLWSRTGVYEALSEHYQQIWVYGSPAVMDFASALGLDGPLSDRITYTGYLGQRMQVPRKRPEGHPRIVVCTGGGVDGGALLAAAIHALRERCDEYDRPLLVGGPLLGERELDRLRSLAGTSPLTVSRFVPDLDRRIAEADVVVTMPGYNTTCELLSGSARAIVIPRTGPSQEQRLRSAWLMSWGRAAVMDHSALDGGVLRQAIEERLSSPPPETAPVPINGLNRAGALLEAVATGTNTVAPG